MSNPALVINRKRILRITLKRRLRQYLSPLCAFVKQLVETSLAADVTCIKRALLRIVTTKEAGVGNDSMDPARHTKTNDAPVKARATPPPRFPTIHPFPEVGILAFDKNRWCRLQQILFRCKEFIIGKERCATKSF